MLEKSRIFFLYILFLSIPFSIAGDDFAIIGLYLCTIILFIKGREQWIPNRMIIGIGIFLLGAVISSLASDDPLTSFSYFRNFWRLGLPFLVFFALKDESHEPFINLVLIVSVLVALYSTIQFFTGIGHGTS